MVPLSQTRVFLAAESHRGFDCGVGQIVAAIRPTLGPLPRAVAVQRLERSMIPELLDDGAEIARRIIALPGAREDAGAMYLRGFLRRLQKDVGDGGATAAVIFAAMLKGGRLAIASGVPAQLLRPQLERAGELVRRELASMAIVSHERQDLIHAACSVCHDDELAGLLGDAFDVAGEYGEVVIAPSKRRESWREFVAGSYWDGGVHSTPMLRDAVRQRTDIVDAALVVGNLAIDDPLTLAPALHAARSSGAGGLAVVAKSISADALAILAANGSADFPIVAVRSPGLSEDDRRGALQDLAVMTGGRAFLDEAGDRLGAISASDLGRARRIWATPQQFGIVSGGGDARAVRAHIGQLASRHDRAANPEERRQAAHRLGKFHGVSSTIWVGADSVLAASGRIEVAGRTALVVRRVIRHGSVAGGGAALLACRRSLLARMAGADDPAERAALRVVADALEAPFRGILENCGFEAAPALARLAGEPAGYGFDARTGRIVEMREAGILDPAAVLAAAAAGAIVSAALALTIDAIVVTRKTDVSVDPE